MLDQIRLAIIRTINSTYLFLLDVADSLSWLDTPGTYTLGFQQETGDVKRTYYSDQAENEYVWGDISNDHAAVPNSIIVY